jgi:hypothetical protein
MRGEIASALPRSKAGRASIMPQTRASANMATGSVDIETVEMKVADRSYQEKTFSPTSIPRF